MHSEMPPGLEQEVIEFFRQRFRHDLISRGIDYDVVNAAVEAGFDSIEDCYQRALALKAVRELPEFEPISIAFKRVLNILKGYQGGETRPDIFSEPQEKRLYETFLHVREQMLPILKTASDNETPRADQYKEALLLLLGLKPHIDDFFDHVMVMVEDRETRENRLALLWMISRLFLKIGNLSFIVTEG